MAKTIEQLLAESEIKDIQMRYCHAADRRDFALMRECFHPDASTEFGTFAGGVDDFIAAGIETLKAFSVTQHMTGNQLVRLDGDSAWAEHYAIATHRIPEGDGEPERDFVCGIRYVDRVERRDGEWRIARREMNLDWSRIDAIDHGLTTPRLRAVDDAPA
ncbi:MAG: nuclear transport factor 2 family protein [Sphingomonadales bacterium]|nr:nuclear transport factor 2 family protein [Sphingomonadales bacterium]